MKTMRGSNHTGMRQFNERTVLRAIRHEGASAANVHAQRCNYTRACGDAGDVHAAIAFQHHVPEILKLRILLVVDISGLGSNHLG